MNDQLRSRLTNWKFDSAKRYLDGEPEDTKDTVLLLARLFGNCGWFMGDMAALIGLSLRSMGLKDEDE